jgi:hypothetical protein
MSLALLRAGALACVVTGLSTGQAHAVDANLVDASKNASSEQTTNKPAPNSVFLEGMGSGLFYSINYERRVIDDVGVRAGFSYMSMSAGATAGDTTATASSTYVTIPITVSYLGVRGRRSGLEVGGGMTLAYASGSASTGVSSSSGSGMAPIGTAMVGYRLHPVDGAGFQLRAGVMALAAKGFSFDPDPNKFGVLPWIYLSLGAGF